MAAAQVKSQLMAKLGADFAKAHEENKNVVFTPKGTGDLPGGIRNGIARLVTCKIVEIKKGKKNEGNLMFYAAGTVVIPEQHEGFPTKGLFTSITEPIFPTPTRVRKTVAEHIKWIYEHLSGLGLSLASLKPDTIEEAMKALVAAKPYFRFRTWLPPKNTSGQYANREPQVMNFWDGKVDYTPPKDEKKNAIADSGAQVTPPEPDELPPEPGEVHAEAQQQAAQAEVNPADLDRGDIDSLAKRGDDEQDLVAGQELIDMALAAGIDKKLVDDATSFKQVADLIRGKGQAPATPAPSQNGDTQEISIGIGDHWKFFPLDPKSKEKSKEAITVEITELDEAKGLVGFKNIARPIMRWKNVSVDELVPVS